MQALVGGRNNGSFQPRGGSTAITINIRIVNRGFSLDNFPIMAVELVSKFVEKMCIQFTLNKDSLKILSNGKLVDLTQPALS